MSVIKTVANLLNPVGKIIDELFLDGDQSTRVRGEVDKVQRMVTDQMLRYEQSLVHYKSELVKAQAKVLETEGQSKFWLTAAWRPIAMVTFLCLIVCDQFGLLTRPLSPDAWLLLKLGIGGYVGGRTMEKVIPSVMNMVKEKKNGKGEKL